MALQHLGYIELPQHAKQGGFDHAAVQASAELSGVPDTEQGAHTIAFDAARNKVYAFLPQTHRAAVYVDRV
jgi:hypothetical protein